MAEITIDNDAKPSEQLVAVAKQRVTVTDSQGRDIVLEKSSILMQMRFIKAMGDTAANQTYMTIATPVTCVREIAGVPVPYPTTELEFEAILQRLDEAGLEAVMNGYMANFGGAKPDEEKAAVKN